MKRTLVTYLSVLSLLTVAGRSAVAGVTDYLSNSIDWANQQIEKAATVQEEYITNANDYMNSKAGKIGDPKKVAKAAKKAEKAKARAEKLQKKAEKAQAMAEKAKKYQQKVKKAAAKAQKLKEKAEKAAAKANKLKEQATEKVNQAKDAYNDGKELYNQGKDAYADANQKLEEAKELKNNITETAGALGNVAGGALDSAKSQANNATSKVTGSDRQPFAASTPQAPQMTAIPAEQIAAKVNAMPNIQPVADVTPVPTAADTAAAFSNFSADTNVADVPLTIDNLPMAAVAPELTVNAVKTRAGELTANPVEPQFVPLSAEGLSLEEQLTATDNLPNKALKPAPLPLLQPVDTLKKQPLNQAKSPRLNLGNGELEGARHD